MTKLKRSLGLPMLTFYGTGMILGAGIYSIIGKAAAVAGETLWMGFLMAGLAALLTGLSYAELSTMFPKAGAEFTYLREAFKRHAWIATTAGVMVAVSGAATAATVALSFAGHLSHFIDFPAWAIAPLVLLAFTGVAILGLRASSKIVVISTLIEVSGLALIIYFGMTSDKIADTFSARPTLGTFSSTALIIFSFFGFESIANLAQEAKNPERDLPRAIMISLGITTLLYVCVSMSVLALLSPSQLAASNAPLMEAAAAASHRAGPIMAMVALFSTANTALISLIGASRILYGMAKKKALPEAAAKVLPKYKTPWIASIAILAIAMALLPLGKIETVAKVSSLTTLVAFFAVNIALIVLRYTEEHKARPFKIPFHIGKMPLLPVLGAASCAAMFVGFEAQVYVIGGVFLAITMAILFWRERQGGLSPRNETPSVSNVLFNDF